MKQLEEQLLVAPQPGPDLAGSSQLGFEPHPVELCRSRGHRAAALAWPGCFWLPVEVGAPGTGVWHL